MIYFERGLTLNRGLTKFCEEKLGQIAAHIATFITLLSELANQGCKLIDQRWSRGHKARGQGHEKISRPRTDLLRPRTKDTDASVPPPKKGPQNFFSGEKALQKFSFR